jgi:hypothetical protein
MNQKLLKEYLIYNKDTGIFYWNKIKSYKVKKGDIAGQVDKRTGHKNIRICGKLYASHRLAWLYEYGHFPEQVIDHINGVSGDNRISNLRDVSHLVNSQNTIKPKPYNKSSGLCGVSFDKNKFVSRIRINGKKVSIGRFDKKEDAYNSYVKYKRMYHNAPILNK